MEKLNKVQGEMKRELVTWKVGLVTLWRMQLGETGDETHDKQVK